jgi:hypothetical protein
MGFPAHVFATILGVHRATLYRWEAEGWGQHERVKHPYAFGTRSLVWLLSLDTTGRASTARWIRLLLERKEDVTCHLYMRSRRTSR